MEALQLDMDSLLKLGSNFKPIPRFSVKDAKNAIQLYESEGLPVIIEGFHGVKGWPRDMFTPQWLKENGPQDIHVRNIHNKADSTIPIQDFLDKSRSLPVIPTSEESERLYGKDVECPEAWNQWLHEKDVIPKPLLPESPDNMMQALPEEHRVETLMCYLGIGGTFTPCHKDLCASSGQNLMCYTENNGCSVWAMTAGSDAPLVSEYYHSLDRELDHENHLITTQELAKAPFRVYWAEQKLGDLVLVPRRSCHQVVNKGGLTIKTSWSRMTLKGLETAYYHELPIYRRVCRPEIYRVRLTIYHNLLAAMKQLEKHLQSSKASKPGPSRHVRLGKLLHLFEDILTEEFTPEHAKLRCLTSNSGAGSSPDAQAATDAAASLHCDFCHGDIFQSFFECRKCVDVAQDHPSPINGTNSEGAAQDKVAPGEGFAICAGCYVEGRTCDCLVMEPVQCRPFDQLLEIRQRARKLYDVATKQTTMTTSFPAPRGSFYAACLQRERNATETNNRTCSRIDDKVSKHEFPGYSGLNCKQCHRATCFDHHLRKHKLHVVEILLCPKEDSDHHLLHREHKAAPSRYRISQDSFLQNQKNGTKPDMEHQRVYIALEYRNPKPLNQHFSNLGWYDHQLYMRPSHGPNEDSRSSTPLSVVPTKRKRQILDCVDVSDTSINAKKIKKSTKTHDSDKAIPTKIQGIGPMTRARSQPATQPQLRVQLSATLIDPHKGSGRSKRRTAMAPFADSAPGPSRRPGHPLARSISDSLSARSVSIGRARSQDLLSPLTPMSAATTSQDIEALSSALNHANNANHRALDVIDTSPLRSSRTSSISSSTSLQNAEKEKRSAGKIQNQKQFNDEQAAELTLKCQQQEKRIEEQDAEMQEMKLLLRQRDSDLEIERKKTEDMKSFMLQLLASLHLPDKSIAQALPGTSNSDLQSGLRELRDALANGITAPNSTNSSSVESPAVAPPEPMPADATESISSTLAVSSEDDGQADEVQMNEKIVVATSDPTPASKPSAKDQPKKPSASPRTGSRKANFTMSHPDVADLDIQVVKSMKKQKRASRR